MDADVLHCHDHELGRVLVVDDVGLNRKMMCRLLEGHCRETVTAVNGRVAVTLLYESFFDGLMDGPSAAKEMRTMGYTGLIIGVTGNVQAIYTEKFLSHGANSVLHKPIDFKNLANELESKY